MSEEKIREQFEESERECGFTVSGKYNGQYMDDEQDSRWHLWQEAWQASRACLVVELPDPAKARDIAYFHADTLDALQSAGIPTK